MILLDTCALIWITGDQGRLSSAAKHALSANVGLLFVSAISAFEIALAEVKGRIRYAAPVQEWFPAALDAYGLRELPLDARTAALAARLPRLHNDPADRFLIAAARVHGLALLTPDPLIAKYTEVKIIW